MGKGNEMPVNPFEPALFRAEGIPANVKAFNEALLKRTTETPGPAARTADDAAPSPFPPVPKSARASVRTVSTPEGREVSVRVVPPAARSPLGAYLHLHAGGLVFGSADQDDRLLERIADATGLAVISVDYRLAPAHPYPAAWDDCEAVALWLAREVRSQFGGAVLAIGGIRRRHPRRSDARSDA